ncbi:MAG: LamG-like jellyroll fold domain-containing protein [Verrucomicrobiales bacterium]
MPRQSPFAKGLALLAALPFVALASRAPAELIGYWSFDDQTVNDTSGNNKHGTRTGGSFSTDVPSELPAGSRSLNLSGNGYVIVDTGGAQGFYDGGSAFTAMCWFKGWPDNDWEPMIGKNGEGQGGWQIRRNGANNHIDWTTRGAGANNGDFNTGTNEGDGAAGRWAHVAVTFDGIRKVIYYNGIPAKQEIVGSDPLSITPSPRRLVFGARDTDGGTIGNHSNVMLDDVAIFNHVLSAREIDAIARGRSPVADGLSPFDYAFGVGEPLGRPGFWGILEASGGGTINNLGHAYQSLKTGSNRQTSTTRSVINFIDPNAAGAGRTGGDLAFLTNTAAADDDFAVTALGAIRIPLGASADDKWTFYTSGDDGAEVVVFGPNFESTVGNGNELIVGTHASNNVPTGDTNTASVITLPPGDYNVRYLWYERAGGASCELYSRRVPKPDSTATSA